MARIKAVDFAKDVDDNRKRLQNILRNKGVNTKDVSLRETVSNVNLLPDYSEPISDYVPDPYFIKFDEYYKTDPLLTSNGGSYDECFYAVILPLYDTTAIRQSGTTYAPELLITSDGQTLELTSTKTMTITWDKSKDGQTTLFDTPDKLKDGRNVRWIRLYRNYNAGYSLHAINGYSGNESDTVRPLVYALCRTSRQLMYAINLESQCLYPNEMRYLEYVTLDVGEASLINPSCSAFGGPNLKFINNLTTEIYWNFNVGDISISNFTIPCPDITTFRMRIPVTDIRGSYFGYSSITSKVLNIYGVGSSSSITSDFLGNVFSTVEVLNCYIPVRITSMGSIYSLKELNYLGLVEAVEFSIKNMARLETLHCSSANSLLPRSIEILNCPRLSKDSIINLFQCLGDLSTLVSRTCKIPYRFEDLLTDEEKQIAINKNWTLTFVG